VYPNSSQPQETFELHPLIYSAGPDKAFDITTDFGGAGNPLGGLHYMTVNNNPFFGVQTPNGAPDPTWPTGGNGQPLKAVGTPDDLHDPPGTVPPVFEHYDNIHNHLMQTK
jgi:hypothetical protein